LRERKVTQLLVIPLFPHFAMSSFETAAVRVQELAARWTPQIKVEIQPPYFDAPEYIAALVASAKNHLDAGYDHLLFSFHGIPERHLRKADPTAAIVSRSKTAAKSPARRTRRATARNVSKPLRRSSQRPACRRKNTRWRSSRGSARSRG